MMTFMNGSRASQMIAAMLGMAGPITVGVMTGHPQAGLLASLGGLALSGDGKGATFREQAPGLIYAMIASSAAVFAGSAVAGRGLLTALAIPAVVAMIGLLGGISRPLAGRPPNSSSLPSSQRISVPSESTRFPGRSVFSLGPSGRHSCLFC